MKLPQERVDLSTLWSSFKDTGDPEAREQLILNYSPLVKYVAGRVSANLPQTVENADLISYGLFGLIDAIEKFEPGRRSSSRRTRYLASRVPSSTSCARWTGCPGACALVPGTSSVRSSRSKGA